MLHLYLHLTMGDEHYPDETGQKCDDLAAARWRAVLLVGRVVSFCGLGRRSPHAERCVVSIADAAGKVLMSVIVGCNIVPTEIRNRQPQQPGIASMQRALFDADVSRLTSPAASQKIGS